MAEISNVAKVSKPSPAELKFLIEHWREPLVFQNLTNRWSTWDLDKWRAQFTTRILPFRKGPYFRSEASEFRSSHPHWERYTPTVHMTFDDFLNKTNTDTYNWYYFDYKRLPEWFPPTSEIINNISWKEFGLNSVSAVESNIWIGSKGAHTPCHIDTYEYNLVMQIYGEKRWILIPPSVENMQPTRIPYEESSIYSKLNFFHPDPEQFKNISGAREVILTPGDILFVPQGWWHYVESLSLAISINAWVPTKETTQMQLKEAIVQLIVSQFSKNVPDYVRKHILNPNNDDITELSLSHLLEVISNKTNALNPLNRANKRQKFEETEKKEVVEENSYSYQETDIMEKYKDLIRPVQELTDDEFQRILIEKWKVSYPTWTIKEEDKTKNVPYVDPRETTSELHALDKILNVLCNPEIVNIIANKLSE